jgi:hypothetical protein
MNDELLGTEYLFKKASTQFYFYIFVVESTIQYKCGRWHTVTNSHFCLDQAASVCWPTHYGSALVTLCHFVFTLTPAVSVLL